MRSFPRSDQHSNAQLQHKDNHAVDPGGLRHLLNAANQTSVDVERQQREQTTERTFPLCNEMRRKVITVSNFRLLITRIT